MANKQISDAYLFTYSYVLKVFYVYLVCYAYT